MAPAARATGVVGDERPGSALRLGSAPWHAAEAHAVAEALGVDPERGLEPAEVAERRRAAGENRLEEPRRRSPARLLRAQFEDLMVCVLLAAAGVAGLLGEFRDALVILAIVALDALLGFLQELRAERAMEALRALAAPMARVRRGGVELRIPAVELVPGDLVRLEAGEIVPADLRLVAVQRVRMDESMLTGESQPVDKHTRALPPEPGALGERGNLAFKGTVVTYGRGEGLVVATGMATELGRVAALLAEATDTRTPLQRRLRSFARQLAWLVLALCALVFALGLLRGEPPLVLLLTALSLAVAAMPEALPAVVTVALALGARRMAARQALVRRLPAVETLGSVTTIASDKTGTLTQNRMEVAAVRLPPFAPSVEAASDADQVGPELLRAMLLDCDARSDGAGELVGDPTETALLRHALAELDAAALLAAHPRLAELPFSSERGRMSTLHAAPEGGPFLVTKGAPERVLALCRREAGPEGSRPLAREAALAAAGAMAAAGLRVLAFATREGLGAELGGPEKLGEHHETELVLLGLVGLRDAPRPGAREAVGECRRAGIRVLMVTGDHPDTAEAIARELDLAEPGSGALTGAELARLDDAALDARLDGLCVTARVAPEQKIRLVRALQARGEFVAMTGDGVNDAPALRQADIGIAMGQTGTEVAREAADMVLLDDDFTTLVAAVREGRRVYDNVRKFIRYVLTGNSAEIWALLLAPVFGLPLPLLPIHILWINLVTDGLPGLALALEPAERDVMRRPPRPPQESILARGLLRHTLWVGLWMGALSLVAQALALRSGSGHWHSTTFTVLALAQLGHALAVRSERESLFRLPFFGNPALAATVLGTVALQLAALYLPPLRALLRTEALSASELFLCFGLAALVPLAVELEKLVLRRKERRPRGVR